MTTNTFNKHFEEILNKIDLQKDLMNDKFSEQVNIWIAQFNDV